jgi:hypothetical protein
MGRPKKRTSDKQTEKVTIYLTPSESERVRASAGILPVATWARQRLLSVPDDRKAA